MLKLTNPKLRRSDIITDDNSNNLIHELGNYALISKNLNFIRSDSKLKSLGILAVDVMKKT